MIWCVRGSLLSGRFHRHYGSDTNVQSTHRFAATKLPKASIVRNHVPGTLENWGSYSQSIATAGELKRPTVLMLYEICVYSVQMVLNSESPCLRLQMLLKDLFLHLL